MVSARERRRRKKAAMSENKPGTAVALYDAEIAAIGLRIQERNAQNKKAVKAAKPIGKVYPTKKYTPHSYLLTGETLGKQVIGTCGGHVRKCDSLVRHGDDYAHVTTRENGVTKLWYYHPECWAA